VDDLGNTTIFRGVSAIDPVLQRYSESGEQAAWSERYYHEMGRWGANVVRIPILPSSLREYGMEKTLETLDQTIRWAAANGMYVIIDFHSLGWPPDGFYPPNSPWYRTTDSEILDFWVRVSTRYADENTVAFYELFNEPVTRTSHADYSGKSASLTDWVVWKQYAEAVISVIRVHDAHKIILVGGLQYSYDLSFVPQLPIAGQNVGYSVHPYFHPGWAKGWDEAFGNLSAEYAIFATEFGCEKQDCAEEARMGLPYMQSVIDYLEWKEISWTVWIFDAITALPVAELRTSSHRIGTTSGDRW
jgi:aryl-phospho-beta-D-glucosidase BglC (GH1 family)